jgi:hypothetical protein
MLTREQFHRYIEEKRKYFKKVKALYELSVEYSDTLADYLDDLVLALAFNPSQKETVLWWLYDAPDGVTGQVDVERTRIYCSTTKEVIAELSTVDALYDYLITCTEEQEH